MVLIAKERQAKRRAKLKMDKEAYQLYAENDRLRKASQRFVAKEKMSKYELEEYHMKERQRTRAYRKKQPSQESSTTETHVSPYRSTQALGKAVKRAQTSLPTSPRKRRFVVETIADRFAIQCGAANKSNVTSRGALSEEVKAQVIDFYNNSDISWQAPGRKDRIIIREKNNDGTKVKKTKQVRYMLMSLREAHKAFDTQCPSQVGLSKFCEFRPKHVKLFDHIPHSVCVCAYHENIRLLLVTLKDYTTLSTDFLGFINQVTCDSSSKQCMSRQCMECKDFLERQTPTDSTESLVRYQQWKTDDKVENVNIIVAVRDVFAELQNQLTVFLIHTFIKRKQAAHMDKMISKCDGESVVLQVDFSENATITSQNEIQSAHWNHGQATLFTGYSWINEDTNESFVLVSDSLSHTKHSVYVYMSHIFNLLKEKYPSIKMLTIFSDGASSQFKQRFLFSNLHFWEQEHGIGIKWNFFATSHGKGVVDGIGGTVKRSVWRHIKSGQAHIETAEEYANVTRERNPNVIIQFISKDEIAQSVEKLDNRWKTVLAVPKTHQVHCVFASGKEKVMVSETSDATDFVLVPKRPELETTPQEESACESTSALLPMDLTVGQWVMVKYDGNEFPGEVTQCYESDVEVSVMHKSASYWKWPESVDKIFYQRCDILRIISAPTVVGSRGQFKFV